MKCYRCGEENPKLGAGTPEQDKLIDKYIQALADVTDLKNMLGLEQHRRKELETELARERDPRNAYGLSLSVEQEKVEALIGVIEEATKLLTESFDVAPDTADEFDDQFGKWRARKQAWLAHPTVTAALREVKP